MQIRELFNDLEPFNGDSDKIFNAIQIPEYEFAKVGKSNKGFPAIIIALDIESSDEVPEQLALENLILYTDPNCIISDGSERYKKSHSILVLLSSEKVLIECFLSLSQSMLELIAKKRTYQNVKRVLLEIVEIFKQTRSAPQKTIQGLWAELLIICISKDVDIMIDCWHSSPNAIFDFSLNEKHLEVKSSTKLDRVHSFSLEQLDPLDQGEVTIASVFTIITDDGATIFDLIEQITPRVQQSINIYKLNSTVVKTIGSDVDKIDKLKFDEKMAIESLRVYNSSLIPRINRSSLPKGVSNVRYSVDLGFAESINLSEGEFFWPPENEFSPSL